MPTRLGLRVNPVSGTSDLGLDLSGGVLQALAFSIEGEDQYAPGVLDILDADGGTTGTFGAPPYTGIYKSVSSGTPWTVWFDAVDGDYTYVTANVVLFSSLVDLRVRFILEVDGIETEIFNEVLTPLDAPLGDLAASYGQDVSFSVSSTPPGYTNFWTDFNKTRENAP